MKSELLSLGYEKDVPIRVPLLISCYRPLFQEEPFNVHRNASYNELARNQSVKGETSFQSCISSSYNLIGSHFQCSSGYS